MKELKFKIEGMMCEGCENRVKNALMTIAGVEEVFADHTTGNVVVKTTTDNEGAIREEISDLGYEIVEE